MQDNFENMALELFLQETEESIQSIEKDILALEASPKDSALIDSLFRHVHTVKGGAGMVMLTELYAYAHQLENLLSKFRGGKMEMKASFASLLLESIDCMESFVREAKGEGALDQALIDRSRERIRQYGPADESGEIAPEGEPVEASKPETPDVTAQDDAALESYFIHLKYPGDTFEKGVDPLSILKDLSELGSMAVIPHTGAVPVLSELDARKLYLWWTIKLTTRHPESKIKEVLMFLLEEEHARIRPVSKPPSESEEIRTNAAGETTFSTTAAPAAQTAETIAPPVEKETPPDSPPLEPEVSAKTVTSFADVGQGKGEAAADAPKPKASSSIRVDILKLDKLQNLVGEVVINQSRLIQVKDRIEELSESVGEFFLQILDDNERIVRELQEEIMNVRMVPIGNTFTPLQRMVRDFTTAGQKKIHFRIMGEETEIDKTITEQLSGPLKHLIRNAMDHGIEVPEVRKQLGKPEAGTIALKAYHQEGFVVVEVQDDGSGINAEKVLAIASEKGLLKEGEALSEQEILHLIFNPGLSTAETVTDVSGRGVGMDAVKQGIDALRGTIRIISRVNRGTTFQIKLPLTLAIIEGMLVRIGIHTFTIPLLSIVESLKPGNGQVKTIQQEGEVVEMRGDYLPLLRLHKILQVKPDYEDPSQALVIIVEHVGRRYCLLVDDVIDQQQVVIKSLEENFIQLPGLAGATILGDGRISLILDVPGIIQQKHLS